MCCPKAEHYNVITRVSIAKQEERFKRLACTAFNFLIIRPSYFASAKAWGDGFSLRLLLTI
jgi:hypothetical protein